MPADVSEVMQVDHADEQGASCNHFLGQCMPYHYFYLFRLTAVPVKEKQYVMSISRTESYTAVMPRPGLQAVNILTK